MLLREGREKGHDALDRAVVRDLGCVQEVVRPRPSDLGRASTGPGNQKVKDAPVLQDEVRAVVRRDLEFVPLWKRGDEPRQDDPKLVPVAVRVRDQGPLKPRMHCQPEEVDRQGDRRDTLLPGLQTHELVDPAVKTLDYLSEEPALRPVQVQGTDTGFPAVDREIADEF